MVLRRPDRQGNPSDSPPEVGLTSAPPFALNVMLRLGNIQRPFAPQATNIAAVRKAMRAWLSGERTAIMPLSIAIFYALMT